ncbi:MAG: hypothetical protein A3I05_04615 [Deltaproteobacteria bacterium RIFCSPLOWO2_02_FULL_44_10]|nr:MAG: hypothetical protein A3C46_07420 [Deltaproteobacteria bacterium RIFCSPHIGHO2_02_FULL_44_16]OGQ46639.1 MAG: hypothetical protein A3I05_04615 [Deltaproteobacteria bacterium RIFCSPLOWO2_02_FULL_44_10]
MQKNILHHIRKTVEHQSSSPCFHFKRAGRWEAMSWHEMWSAVMESAKGLVAYGLCPGEPVALFAATSVEWTLADLAILAAGGITVPLYPSLVDETISYILKDASPRFLFVDDEHKYQKLIALGIDSTKILQFSAFEKIRTWGKALSDDTIYLRIDQLASEVPASYIYTSGTTGKPKGVVITHGNIVAEVEAAQSVFHFPSSHIGLVVLPLAHVLARVIQFFQLASGCQAAYAENIEKLAENYREVRPHFIVGVPRMLEKMHERIIASVEKLSSRKQRLFAWALKIGEEYSEKKRTRATLSWSLKFFHVMATFLVFGPLRQRMGGRLSLFISGGAPLSKSIARFFYSVGLLVLEGYGLTETFGAITVNRPDDYHFGTVGKALPGVWIRWASDGELLVKGPMVFREYLHQPEETKAAFDDEGWLKTGDIGEYSKDGFLRITDRKKNIIVTSGGKNIAPQPIEEMLLRSPFIDHVMLVGDARKYLIAVLSVQHEALMRYFQEKGESWSGKVDAKVEALIAEVIASVNAKLSSYETIKRFLIVEGSFTIEGGDLTPTLKLKRDTIYRKYQPQIEALYKSS